MVTHDSTAKPVSRLAAFTTDAMLTAEAAGATVSVTGIENRELAAPAAEIVTSPTYWPGSSFPAFTETLSVAGVILRSAVAESQFPPVSVRTATANGSANAACATVSDTAFVDALPTVPL